MKVQVDHQLCSGTAMCWKVAPDVFKVDDAGYVIADDAGIIEVPAEVDHETIREAVLGCPEGALSVLN